MDYADSARLYNRRILVVEDEALIAMLVRDTLSDVGCRPIIAGDLNEALVLAGREQVACALLDIGLGDHTVFPVADVLARRNIPFTFMSGHRKDVIPERHQNRPLLIKPFPREEVVRTILDALRLRPIEQSHVQEQDTREAEAAHANSN